MRHPIYNVIYSVVSINFSLLTATVCSSVRKIPVYNDTFSVHDVINEVDLTLNYSFLKPLLTRVYFNSI